MDAVTLIEQAKNLHLTLSVTNGDLNITGPKTMAAAALVQRMAPFKTDIIAALAPLATIPMTQAPKPPLPADMWVTAVATFAEARRVQKSLSGRYVTACGKGEAGFYVAAPYSGLCAVRVPYPSDTGADDFELTFQNEQPDSRKRVQIMSKDAKRTKQTRDVVISGHKTVITGLVESGELLSFWYFIKFPCGGWVDFDIRYFGISQDEWLRRASRDLVGSLEHVAEIIEKVDAFTVIRDYKQSSEA